MSETIMARVPKKWLSRQKKFAKHIKVSVPKAIEIADNLFAEVGRKKGRRKDKIEIFIKK